MNSRSEFLRWVVWRTGAVMVLVVSGLVVGSGGATVVEGLAADESGYLVAWGNSDPMSPGLTSPPAGDDFNAIAAGGVVGLALKADGSIIGWGDNTWGAATPPAGSDYIAIDAGAVQGMALRADGSIVGWGQNNAGQAIPPAGDDFIAVSAGYHHNLGLTADGSIVGSGGNYNGEATPPAGNHYTAIAAGYGYSLALKADGSIVGWGSDFEGRATPPAGNDYVAIAAGYWHGIALKSNGSIVGWGGDLHGQATPPAGNDYVAIVAGAWHNLALKTDGSIVGWGLDTDGQSSPPTGQGYVAISAEGFSLALRAESPYGELTPLTPARILDTRTGNGRGGVVAPLGADRSFTVQVTGRGGVPATGVSAVVMNVTVTEPTAPSYLTVWPAGEELPTVSNLNYVAGQTVPNLVTVAVGEDGRVQVFNRFGSTHVIFDVVGFYADDTGPEGSRFHAIDPYRYFDTRTGRGGVDVGPRGPNSVLRFNAVGKGGVPSHGVTSVVMNVTVTQPTMPSFLTVYPDDVTTRPLASNLNFVPGQTVPNLVTVRVPASGVIDFYNLQGDVHVIADVVGYYDDDKSTEAGRFIGLVPERNFDSREIPNGAWGPDDRFGIGTFPGFAPIRLGEAEAIVLNVTVTEPTEPSFLTVFPSDLCEIPLASNLNFVAGQTVPNHVVVRLGTDTGCAEPDWLETISVYNRFGNVHVIIDIFGAFTAPTTTLFD